MNLYLDTETVGLNGPCKLIQFSRDRGSVQMIRLYRGWMQDEAVRSQLYSVFADLHAPSTTLIGYNIGFDLYHLYRVLHEFHGNDLRSFERPIDPFRCTTLDLYMHAVRFGPFAPWAFNRKNGRRIVVMRKVPIVAKDTVIRLVEGQLAARLPEGVRISRSEHKVKTSKDLITLSWIAAASLGLKPHAEHFGADKVQHIEDVWPLPVKDEEKQWLPYPGDYWNVYAETETACEKVMRGEDARSAAFYKYTEDDIKYLWRVEDGLKNPTPDHHDAAVAYIAYTRYHGFPLDRAVLLRTRDVYAQRVKEAETILAGVNLRSPKQRLEKLKSLDPIIGNSSKKTLKVLARENDELGKVAATMLGFGPAIQRLNQVEKLLECLTGRAHPDLRPMGTATQRMAGTAGFNFQGIAQAEWIDDQPIGIRAAILALYGGDMVSFELAIAASAWNDVQMLQDLEDGTDIHLATALEVHPLLQEVV